MGKKIVYNSNLISPKSINNNKALFFNKMAVTFQLMKIVNFFSFHPQLIIFKHQRIKF